MSLEVKRFCDKCGKQIASGHNFMSINVKTYKHSLVNIISSSEMEFTGYARDFELCMSCAGELNWFLVKGGK